LCGIFGIIGKAAPVQEQQVRALTDLVAHRGPDGSGLHVDGQVGLGHRRLAIIDLSASGAQPMHHASEPLWITFNGAIFNYLELRRELELLGATFRSASDTEVLLNAYAVWGERCLDRLNGMWAFVIYDQRDGTLFCARDRFGIKPIYYVDSASVFAIGSEIRQLLPLIGNRRADAELVDDFLLSGLTDHSTRTFFSGIEKLAPGHYLRADVRTGRFKIERYYRLLADGSAAETCAAAAPGRVRELLEDAVRLRLRSDVRVGTCLSGGLDSSSVAALAAAAWGEPPGAAFSAITAVSEQPSNNEEAYAAQVVEHCGLNWIRTRPTYEDFSSALEQLIDIQEEPFGGPSIMMQYAVMKAARANGVVVLLDGQGGDETLLGYDRHYAALLRDGFRGGGIRGSISVLRSALAANANLSLRRLAIIYAGMSWATARSLSYRWRYGFMRNLALSQSLRRLLLNAREGAEMQVVEIAETSLPMLLRFEDKNSAHFAIEARLPYLDHRFVEFALGLPVRVKMYGGWSKWPLRQAMAGLLPESICWRRNKIAFAAPDQLWLNRHHARMRHKVLDCELLARHVDLKALAVRFDGLDLSMRWRLYCLAIWSEQFGVSA
jgi:asparagine synthase (glutamine-hydrolysing)